MPLRPVEHKCIGFQCRSNDFFCVDRCPEKALTLRLNPILETLGDYRWPAEMLIGHWEMAETGDLPVVDVEYNLGNSGGGFDKNPTVFPNGFLFYETAFAGSILSF